MSVLVCCPFSFASCRQLVTCCVFSAGVEAAGALADERDCGEQHQRSVLSVYVFDRNALLVLILAVGCLMHSETFSPKSLASSAQSVLCVSVCSLWAKALENPSHFCLFVSQSISFLP